MNVGMQLKDSAKRWTRRLAMPVLALAVVASFATYECVKPAAARAAAAAPSAAPLDVDSVSSLLALDKAMETLAARVTPAVVNVTVTSRTKAEWLHRYQ
jgi:serine protease Do